MNTAAIINDPNDVPLALENGNLLVNEIPDRFIIVSSTVVRRNADATELGRKRSWLKRQVRYLDGSTSKNK